MSGRDELRLDVGSVSEAKAVLGHQKMAAVGGRNRKETTDSESEENRYLNNKYPMVAVQDSSWALEAGYRHVAGGKQISWDRQVKLTKLALNERAPAPCRKYAARILASRSVRSPSPFGENG
jgi:hypothetical protein